MIHITKRRCLRYWSRLQSWTAAALAAACMVVFVLGVRVQESRLVGHEETPTRQKVQEEEEDLLYQEAISWGSVIVVYDHEAIFKVEVEERSGTSSLIRNKVKMEDAIAAVKSTSSLLWRHSDHALSTASSLACHGAVTWNGIPIDSSGKALPIHPTNCGWCLRTYPGKFTLGRPRCSRWNGILEEITNSSLEHCKKLAPPAMSWVCNLRFKEESVFSQNGEDGIIKAMAKQLGASLGPLPWSYVEFGVEDGKECNTRYLREGPQAGNWTGFMMDGGNKNDTIRLYQEIFTSNNICTLLDKYQAPKGNNLTLLSVDTDLYDYWILKEILETCAYHPRMIILEYNGQFGPGVAWTVPRSIPNMTMWDLTDYYGASLLAYTKLVRSYGYKLLYTDEAGVNAFFAHESVLAFPGVKEFCKNDAELMQWVHAVYRPPTYGPQKIVHDLPFPSVVPSLPGMYLNHTDVIERKMVLVTFPESFPIRNQPGKCAPQYTIPELNSTGEYLCLGHRADGESRSMVEV